MRNVPTCMCLIAWHGLLTSKCWLSQLKPHAHALTFVPLIGAGFSEVYMGHHKLSGQEVAIKVVAMGQHAGITAEEVSTSSLQAACMQHKNIHGYAATCTDTT